ncbi:formyltransferase family protein [Mucilaginibacter sp.]|uniref:methionyl-tRNA formyltransferase n=1 Tax=Mucilaginibacter sp. TaxID=1882438 RepID=UPI0026067906|nr:formyltransferase family protein [Mucilaginibacter sp.]MDB4922821.1 Methionyl-tRNA formyltransferase [Mucilaginibacter sp.]
MIIGIVSNSAKLYIPLLSYLYNYKNKAGVILYVGRSTDPENNPGETTKFCNAAGIALTFENGKDDLYSWQQINQPDIIFFSGYGNIIKTDLLNDVKYGLFNIHFGLLPQFRGPSPVFWQLKKGLKEIGLVIHKMTNELDSGPVMWQYKIPNQPHINYDMAYQLFGELQVKGIIEILDALNAGKKLPGSAQDESKAAYYDKPKLNDVLINWNEMEASEIVDLVKACNSWNMGAITAIGGMELKILDAFTKTGNNLDKAPGTIIETGDDFIVACKGNKILFINFFKINNSYVPARFAVNYGFKTGQYFLST